MFAREVTTAQPKAYVSPDGTLVLPAFRVFTQGPGGSYPGMDETGWRWSHALDAFSLIPARPGQRDLPDQRGREPHLPRRRPRRTARSGICSRSPSAAARASPPTATATSTSPTARSSSIARPASCRADRRARAADRRPVRRPRRADAVRADPPRALRGSNPLILLGSHRYLTPPPSLGAPSHAAELALVALARRPGLHRGAHHAFSRTLVRRRVRRRRPRSPPRPALAGPPFICHAFELSGNPSLPWGNVAAAGWNNPDPAYDVSRLTGDVTKLLTPATPVSARMETLRRATIYASRDKARGGVAAAGARGAGRRPTRPTPTRCSTPGS